MQLLYVMRWRIRMRCLLSEEQNVHVQSNNYFPSVVSIWVLEWHIKGNIRMCEEQQAQACDRFRYPGHPF
jgi:hypothetical protein